MDVRFRGKNGRAADITGTTEFTPGILGSWEMSDSSPQSW